ncbi:MAG: ABATE domain-containing protein [Actinomycetes bacterium]
MRALPDRLGGRLSLDFVNTVDPRFGSERREYLADYDAVLDWCDAIGVSLPRPTSWLRRISRRRSAEAEVAHRQVIATREALFDVLEASLTQRPAPASAVAQLNVSLGAGIAHRSLAPDDRGGVRETWRTSDNLEQVLWPVAIDAWDLLTEPELLGVKQCPPESGGCGWLFLDLSRSGTRRWCDMRTCGNRAKARAHYQRHSR